MHRFIGVYVEGMGAKVGQYITHHRPRQAGTSKYNLFRTFKVLIDLITVWFLKDYRSKPGYVFGGFGGLLLLASALVSVWVLWDKFVLDVYVHKNPLFLISILFAIVGVQFIGLGLLAELLIRNYYETSGKEPYQIVKRVGFSNGVDH